MLRTFSSEDFGCASEFLLAGMTGRDDGFGLGFLRHVVRPRTDPQASQNNATRSGVGKLVPCRALLMYCKRGYSLQTDMNCSVVA